MAEENKSKKHQRTSPDQLRLYISFVKEHPQMMSGKNCPTDKKMVDDLWREHGNGLNSIRGALRDHVQWKESLQVWKHQLRCRARKQKAHMLATGGGTALAGLSDFEEMALAVLGSEAVEGISTAEVVGFEEAYSIAICTANNTDDGKVCVNEDEVRLPTQTNMTPSCSKKKRRLDTVYEKAMNSIETRNNNENKTAEGMAFLAAAIQQLGSSIEKLAESVSNMKK